MMNVSQLKYLKNLYGYSYEKLSEISGIPKGTIQKIFTEVTKSPRYETLQALEQALQVHSDDIYRQVSEHPDAGILRETPAPYMADSTFDGYTISDYYALPDERRVELIDGVFYDMGAPSPVHQLITFQIGYLIENYIEENDGDCILFVAPCDVQIECDDSSMLQPDVFIVCDLSKIIDRCIYGVPDFIVEVLSKSTRGKDMHIKYRKYHEAGVREYWMIDPAKEQIIVYQFHNDAENNCEDEIALYSFEDTVPVGIYDGKLQIDFSKINRKIKQIQ